MRNNLPFRSGLRALVMASLGAAFTFGCAVDDFAGSEVFACSSSGQCLATHHCDEARRTCVRGPRPDASTSTDGAVTDPDGGSDAHLPDLDATLPDVAVPALDAGADAAADAVLADAAQPDQEVALDGDVVDLAVRPDAVVVRAFCETAEEFSGCLTDGGNQGRCVRQRCCDPRNLDPRCNPIGPGFTSPYNVSPEQRFRLVRVPTLTRGSNLVMTRQMIIDLGTGLSWLPLNANYRSPEGAAAGCADWSVVSADVASGLPNLPNPPAGLVDGSVLRLPDAYELWSLLSFVTPGDTATNSPTLAFDAAGYDPSREEPNGRIVTRVVTSQGSALAVDYATRHMTLAAADANVRVLCVVGGQRPGAGTAPERALSGGGGDWFDPWSRRTWRFNQSYEPGVAAVPDTYTLAIACDDQQEGAVLPTIFDLVTRFDLRADDAGDQLDCIDHLLGGQAVEIPVIVAEPIEVRRLAVEPRRMWGADLDQFAGFPTRKHYCLSGPVEP